MISNNNYQQSPLKTWSILVTRARFTKPRSPWSWEQQWTWSSNMEIFPTLKVSTKQTSRFQEIQAVWRHHFMGTFRLVSIPKISLQFYRGVPSCGDQSTGAHSFPKQSWRTKRSQKLVSTLMSSIRYVFSSQKLPHRQQNLRKNVKNS